MASRSRSRGGNRREQPVQQAQQAVVQQAGVQVQHVDTTRLVVGGLPPSRRLRGCMSRAVCHLQGLPPRLTLAVNPPQTGARIVENGESEDGEIDEMVVDPDQPPEEQPDVQSLWQTVQRLESNVEYLDRWSWHTWHECMKLRSRSQCMLTSPGGGHAHICNARDFHVEEAPQRPDLFGEETVQPFDQTSIFFNLPTVTKCLAFADVQQFAVHTAFVAACPTALGSISRGQYHDLWKLPEVSAHISRRCVLCNHALEIEAVESHMADHWAAITCIEDCFRAFRHCTRPFIDEFANFGWYTNGSLDRAIVFQVYVLRLLCDLFSEGVGSGCPDASVVAKHFASRRTTPCLSIAWDEASVARLVKKFGATAAGGGRIYL